MAVNLEGVSKFMLGSKQAGVPIYRSVQPSIPGPAKDVYNVNRGPSGWIPSATQQFSFMKGYSPVGDDTRNPANRVIGYGLDRSFKEKMNESVNVIGRTRSQIRNNEKSNSGTSRPTTTQFDYTSDYYHLRKPVGAQVEMDLMNPTNLMYIFFVGAALYLLVTKKLV